MKSTFCKNKQKEMTNLLLFRKNYQHSPKLLNLLKLRPNDQCFLILYISLQKIQYQKIYLTLVIIQEYIHFLCGLTSEAESLPIPTLQS